MTTPRRPSARAAADTDTRVDHIHSRNAPDIATAGRDAQAAGDALLVGEVYFLIAEPGAYSSR